jgi:hypothetical protein
MLPHFFFDRPHHPLLSPVKHVFMRVWTDLQALLIFLTQFTIAAGDCAQMRAHYYTLPVPAF